MYVVWLPEELMKKFAIALFAAALLVLAGTADASAKKHAKASLCEKAYVVRVKVIAKHGKRAPGRNICRFKIKTRRGVRDATVAEKGKYLAQLRLLIKPAPVYLVRTAAPPGQAPAGTLHASVAPTGLASCIVYSESRGNPRAVNGQYSGIAQWSQEAWLRHGGGRYAATPLGATYEQQVQVLSNGLARFGCRDWCPWDGC